MIAKARHLLLSGLLLAGAAAAPAAFAQTAVAPAPAASANPAPADAVMTAADVQAGKIGAPPAGKALIVFFRPSGPGGALGFTIREGETNISKIGNGSYQLYLADPGDHAYTIKSEASDTLHIEVDAGETYYVKQTISMGILVGRPHLTLSDKATFDKVSASMRVSKWTPPAEKAESKPAAPADAKGQ